MILIREGKKEKFAGELLIKHPHIINLTAASFIHKQIQNYIKTVLHLVPSSSSNAQPHNDINSSRVSCLQSIPSQAVTGCNSIKNNRQQAGNQIHVQATVQTTLLCPLILFWPVAGCMAGWNTSHRLHQLEASEI